MRTAELTTAAMIMLLSAYFMWHATVLPIGWEPGAGPGGGAFPFWLSAGLFVCGALIFVKQARIVAGPMTIRRVFMHPQASGKLAVTVGSMLVTTLMVDIVGAYVAIPAFLIGYTRVIGRSSWRTALSLGIGSILVMFFFFEVGLKTILPKGITEPLFIPLYAIFF